MLIRIQHADGWISVPEAKPRKLLLGLHVRHPDLQDRSNAVHGYHGSDPRRSRVVAFEGRPHSE
jgi:hypothetical protein